MFWLLLAFWLLLNGRITAEILILGVLICGVIYGWCCKVLGFRPKRELDLARRGLGAVSTCSSLWERSLRLRWM